jgi:hypothetical protein
MCGRAGFALLCHRNLLSERYLTVRFATEPKVRQGLNYNYSVRHW